MRGRHQRKTELSMNSHDNQPMEDGLIEEAVHVEIEIEDRVEVLVLPLTAGVMLVEVIREKLEISEEFHFFERDRDEPFSHPPHGRKHVRLVGYRRRPVT